MRVQREILLVGGLLRPISERCSIVQSKLHPIRKLVSGDEGVLCVVEAQGVDPVKDVVDDEVVVGTGDRHALAFLGVGDGVVSDIVQARAPVPIRRGLWGVSFVRGQRVERCGVR